MADLHLDSLEIKNFRTFKHLTVERLGRVNLIVGKNGVGKTALLEALRVYGRRGMPPAIGSVLRSRDEVRDTSYGEEGIDVEEQIRSIANLFYQREKIESSSHKKISIGPCQSSNDVLHLSVGFFTEIRGEEGQRRLRPLDEGKTGLGEEVIPGLRIQYGEEEAVYRLNAVFREAISVSAFQLRGNLSTNVYVDITGLDNSMLSDFWDYAILNAMDDEALKALRIIEPDVTSLRFTKDRLPVLSTEDHPRPVFLRSKGDGMTRMLGIALALINAEDSLLLIDEINTGLHYSVQPDMWRLVFETAKRLNVQVFATTHSLDCLRAFEHAASEHEEEDSMLVSLRRHQEDPEKIVAVLAGKERLESIVRSHIEVR